MTSKKFTMLQAFGFVLVRLIQVTVTLARDAHGSWLYFRYGKPQLPATVQRPVGYAMPNRQQGPTAVSEPTNSQVSEKGTDASQANEAGHPVPDTAQRCGQLDGDADKVLPVSDRVRTSTVVASGMTMGVLWLYLYPTESKARRVFKVLDAGLARALGFSRYYYPDVPYDPVEGTDRIMGDFKKLVACQLDRRPASAGVRSPKEVKPQKVRAEADQGRKVRDALAALAPKASLQDDRAEQQPASPVRKAQEHDARPQSTSFESTVPDVVAPAHMRKVRGSEQVGVITSSGVTQRPDGRGGSYKTFCLTLHDGSVELPMFGVELERQARDLGLRVGEKVRVVSMGRQTVDGEDGSKFRKNLYQVTRVAQ